MKFLQLIDALREGVTFHQGRHPNGVLYFKQGNIFYDESRETAPEPGVADPLFIPSMGELFGDVWLQIGDGPAEVADASQLDQFVSYLVEGGMVGRQLPNKQWIFVRLQDDAIEAIRDGSMVGILEPYPGVADELPAWFKAGPFEYEDVVNPAKILRHLAQKSDEDPTLSAYHIHPMVADFTAGDWKPLFTLEEATESLANQPEVPTPVEEPTPDTTQVTTDMSKYLKLAGVCELLQPFQSRLDGVKFNQIEFETKDVPLLIPTKGEQLLDAIVRVRDGEVSLTIGEGTADQVAVKFHRRSGVWTQDGFDEAYIEKSTFLGAINRRLNQPIEDIATLHLDAGPMAIELHYTPEPTPVEDEQVTLRPEDVVDTGKPRSSFEQLADKPISDRKFFATQGLGMIVELRTEDGPLVKIMPITGKARGEIQTMSSVMFHDLFDEFSGPLPGLELANNQGLRVVVLKPNSLEEGWICLLDLGSGYQPIGLTDEQLAKDFAPVGFQHAVDVIQYYNPLGAAID